MSKLSVRLCSVYRVSWRLNIRCVSERLLQDSESFT